jgi:hypothetical protein
MYLGKEIRDQCDEISRIMKKLIDMQDSYYWDTKFVSVTTWSNHTNVSS